MKVLNQIMEEIKAYDTIIVHRHQRPDPDALGSQGGLVEILKASFPEKRVLKAGDTVDGLAFLSQMDKVTDEDYTEALVITVDTANQPRVSDQRYHTGKKLIKIDHHPNDDPYGDLLWIETEASSCSEMIYDFYDHHHGELTMTTEAARLLYAGIVGDTGRFLYPATTPHTLCVAAELSKYPFSTRDLNDQMNVISRDVAKLSGYVLESLEIDEFGIAKVVLTNEVMEKFGVKDSETSAVVSLPGTIEGVVSWGIFVEQPKGDFRIRLRSKGPVINELAKKYHGGGHPLASGAHAKDLAEAETLYQDLREIGKSYLAE